MKHRITEEGYWVEDGEAVYEILYHYYNAETSLAEPHLTEARKVPTGYKIFKNKNVCHFACVQINRKNGHNV